MRQNQPLARVSRFKFARRLCVHQFEVAKIGQRYIAGLWICLCCGERVRRQRPKSPVNA
jgi:hypothetical protein